MSNTTSLVSLSDQLQQLTDRQTIADLITRLGRMLDEKRFDDARTIVTDNVYVETPSGPAQGPEAVVAKARRNHTVTTQHVISDVLIDLDGDRASARANLIVTFAPNQVGARLTIGDAEPEGSRLTVGERYRFEAVRTGDGWRLERIEVKRLWSSHPLMAGAVVKQTAGRGNERQS